MHSAPFGSIEGDDDAYGRESAELFLNSAAVALPPAEESTYIKGLRLPAYLESTFTSNSTLTVDKYLEFVRNWGISVTPPVSMFNL